MSIDPRKDRDFRVPLNYVAPYLDGVYLAVNAIPDAYLVYHAHDCGYFKAEKVAANHDLFSDLLRWDQMKRIVRTNIGNQEFVMGGESKLSARVRQVAERYNPGMIFVASSNVVILSGEDTRPAIKQLSAKIPIPLIPLPERNVYLDYLTGYLDTLSGFLAHAPFDNTCESKGVAVIGYIYHRHEGDCKGDVAELTRLLAGIGAPDSLVLLNGQPVTVLRAQAPPAIALDIAEGWTGGAALTQRFGTQVHKAGLPLGIAATGDWLRLAGEALGKNEQAEAFIERELSDLVAQLQWLIPRHFMGKGVMLFADRLTLPYLARMMEELGMEVLGLGVTSFEFDREPSSSLAIGAYPMLPIHAEPLRAVVRKAREEGRLDLVIGNSLIHQNLAHSCVPFVEVGYPCNYDHALSMRPLLGYTGVRVLVERIVNAQKLASMHAHTQEVDGE
jgi:nitrogenase molybdenum-iron protein alpha/beta subunit